MTTTAGASAPSSDDPWEEGSFFVDNGAWFLPFVNVGRNSEYYSAARLLPRGSKWTLEMWRSNPPFGPGWEYVRRFDNLEEAKATGLLLARVEN